MCNLLPLEVAESTEGAAISHLYPVHPSGHLDTQWDSMCDDLCMQIINKSGSLPVEMCINVCAVKSM